MKRIKIISWILSLCMLIQVTPVSAAENAGAIDWTISNISLEHTTVEFRISGVQSAQAATVVVETDGSYMLEEEEGVYYEIPFLISSSTENIKLDIPNGDYLPAGYYNIYVKDADENTTIEKNASVYSHYYFPDYELYPNWAEITNSYDTAYNVRLTVGFKDYDIKLEPNSTQIIEYPTQELDTAIEIKWWDDYGCSDSYTGTVENEILSLPTLYVFKDSITADWINIGENERIVAEVEGKIYYSEYGDGENTYKTIPNFIIFPQVSEGTNAIKVWMESKNGSISEIKKIEIGECNLEDCDITCNAYLAQTIGSVKENRYGNKIARVSTIINNIEYSCNVDDNGDFTLTYPKQVAYKKITLKFLDKHGCSINKQVEIFNSLEYTECDIVALVSKATGEVYKDCRLVAKIGSKLYYSEYATSKQYVTVSYPKQKPGQPVTFWYEKKDTSQSPIYKVAISDREYYISVNARTTSIEGRVEGEPDNTSNYKISVKVGGKEYECTMKKRDDSYDEDYIAGADFYYDFSCKYPKQKVGKKIQVVVRDSDGYEYVKNIVLKNMKPVLSISRIDTSTTKVKGHTVAKSNITIKVGSKKYKGKANKNGDFSIKIKSKKSGTKVVISVVSPEGYTNKKTKKIVKTYGYPELSKYVYKTSTAAKVTIYGGNKGDMLKIKIGSKTYTKKINKNKKKQKISVKIQKASAGTNIKMTLYDKFGKKKDSYSSKVYFGDKIYVGMDAKDVALTTWGPPIRKNDWGTGSVQWVFSSGASTLYAYIRNGKVVNLQRLNY